MADWRSRDDRDPRFTSHQHSRSPPIRYQAASVYRPDYDSSSSRRKSVPDDAFPERSSKHPTTSARAGNGSPSTHRGTEESPSDYRSQDPRRPNRIGTNMSSETHPSTSVSAGFIDSPGATWRPSVPAQGNSTTSTHVGIARKQNDSQSEAKVLEDQITSILQRMYDVSTAAAPLIIQKERAQQKKESEERDAKKYEMLTTGFPAAAEQREEQKRKLAETIKQNDIKLERNLAQRDKIARDFAHLVSSSILQPTEPNKGHNAESEERHLKLFDELEQMNSKLDSKTSDIRSLKKIEADVAEVRKESKTSIETLNILQEKGDRQAEALNKVTGRVKKEEEEARLLQAHHDQLKIELSQLQIEAKTPQGLDQVNNDIRGLSIRIAEGLGQLNDKVIDLTTCLDSHGKMIQRLEQEQGSQEKEPTATSDQNVKLEAAFDNLTRGLQEAKSEFQKVKNDQEEVNKLFDRCERFFSIMEGDRGLQNRVLNLETDLERNQRYQLRKEDMVVEETDRMKDRLDNVEKEVRQTQANILEVTTRLTKIDVNTEHLAKNQPSPSSSNNVPPHPQALQSENNAPLLELQRQLKQYQAHTTQLTQRVQQNAQTVSAMSNAYQALEGRYNNLTTEPVVRAMVGCMLDMYPYAGGAGAEIETIKTQLLAFQDKPDRQELQRSQTKMTQLEENLQAVIARLDEGERRSSDEENKLFAKPIKWIEDRQDISDQLKEFKRVFEEYQNDCTSERQDFLDRLKEFKRVFEEYQNTCTEELAECDGRIRVLERHFKTGNLVGPDKEPDANHTGEVDEAQGSRSDNINVNGHSQEHGDRQGEAESAANDMHQRKRPRISSSRTSEFEIQPLEKKADVDAIAGSATEPQPKIVRRFLTKDNLRKRKHGADSDEPGAA